LHVLGRSMLIDQSQRSREHQANADDGSWYPCPASGRVTRRPEYPFVRLDTCDSLEKPKTQELHNLNGERLVLVDRVRFSSVHRQSRRSRKGYRVQVHR
jgi:hypothetical protein